MNQDREFRLEDFAGGAVAEQLAVAIGQIYENIADPNREADKARNGTEAQCAGKWRSSRRRRQARAA